MNCSKACLSVAVTLALLALPACIVDGSYRVEGVVTALRNGSEVPIPGAAVAAGPIAHPQKTELTVDDGTFNTAYWFGGMYPFVLFAGDGEPVIDVDAPGYRRCVVRIRDTETPRGVMRRACAKPSRYCYRIDIALVPAGAPVSDFVNACTESAPEE